ncbi:MAG TPA: NAD(P)/FAD-dependent oxidoreductase [Polyangia bacterium]|jgi:NADH dehydrogenase
MMLKKEQTHVVILGGGFGGLAAARALDAPGIRVTLIDRSNHHLFQPLLYQVATAALAAPDVSAPIRQLLSRQSNATVLMGGVQRIEVEKKRVLLEGRHIDYDYLILATGMTHAYFGNDQWAAFAPGLKTIGEALDVRRRILRAFEAAEMETSVEAQRMLTTFVVIGAGPTGVEMAGALAEIAGRTLARDFRRFDPRTTRVILIEAGPRVLPTFPEELSHKAHDQLEELGIEVRVNARVTDLGEDFVELGDETITTRTVLWAAGVRASPLATHLGVPLDRAGRVWVEDDLSVPDRREVFVIGDLIAKTQDGKPLPGVAQLAVQSGRHVAKNILLGVARKPCLPFRYVDKGSMATIGRNRAVAQIGRFKSSGIVAWWLWLMVHVLSLVGFRSRLSVLIEWAFSYFTWQRRSRVILEVPTAPAAMAKPSMVGQVLRLNKEPPPPPNGHARTAAHG